jgi:ethanolamine utilization protein EutP (predicted NTPase)
MKNLLMVVPLMIWVSPLRADETKQESKKKIQYRKTQEVNFDGSDIDGQIRSPDGAYLLQKRGVRFMPLYKVDNQFEKNILESVEFLR